MLFPVLWRPSIAENFVLFYVSIRFALERQSQGGGIPTGRALPLGGWQRRRGKIA